MVRYWEGGPSMRRALMLISLVLVPIFSHGDLSDSMETIQGAAVDAVVPEMAVTEAQVGSDSAPIITEESLFAELPQAARVKLAKHTVAVSGKLRTALARRGEKSMNAEDIQSLLQLDGMPDGIPLPSSLVNKLSHCNCVETCFEVPIKGQHVCDNVHRLLKGRQMCHYYFYSGHRAPCKHHGVTLEEMRKIILRNLYQQQREGDSKTVAKENLTKKLERKMQGTAYYRKKIARVEKQVKRRYKLKERILEPKHKRKAKEQEEKKKDYLNIAAKKLAGRRERERSKKARMARKEKRELRAEEKARRARMLELRTKRDKMEATREELQTKALRQRAKLEEGRVKAAAKAEKRKEKRNKRARKRKEKARKEHRVKHAVIEKRKKATKKVELKTKLAQHQADHTEQKTKVMRRRLEHLEKHKLTLARKGREHKAKKESAYKKSLLEKKRKKTHQLEQKAKQEVMEQKEHLVKVRAKAKAAAAERKRKREKRKLERSEKRAAARKKRQQAEASAEAKAKESMAKRAAAKQKAEYLEVKAKVKEKQHARAMEAHEASKKTQALEHEGSKKSKAERNFKAAALSRHKLGKLSEPVEHKPLSKPKANKVQVQVSEKLQPKPKPVHLSELITKLHAKTMFD